MSARTCANAVNYKQTLRIGENSRSFCTSLLLVTCCWCVSFSVVHTWLVCATVYVVTQAVSVLKWIDGRRHRHSTRVMQPWVTVSKQTAAVAWIFICFGFCEQLARNAIACKCRHARYIWLRSVSVISSLPFYNESNDLPPLSLTSSLSHDKHALDCDFNSTHLHSHASLCRFSLRCVKPDMFTMANRLEAKHSVTKHNADSTASF